MSDRVSFNANLLAQELEEVEWNWGKLESLGAYLGLRAEEIWEVELNQQELASRRTAMLDKWARKQDNASWTMVIEALEIMSELELADKLKEKYLAERVVIVDYRGHAIGDIRVPASITNPSPSDLRSFSMTIKVTSMEELVDDLSSQIANGPEVNVFVQFVHGG